MEINFSLKDFIAEIGVNHENSIEAAMKMIDECAAAGVGAVKFQSYKSNKLAAPHSPSYWDTTKEKTKSQSELFSRYDKFGMDEFTLLAKHCEYVGIEFMTTPFDVEYAQQLSGLLSRYKIASVDLTNKILLSAVAETGKPVIMSTGASTTAEIARSVDFLMSNGVSDLTLLHCITNYPTPTSDAALQRITILREQFPAIKIGYSDHTLPADSQLVLLRAIALGASVVEKHYTFNKQLPGNDHYHAFDSSDLLIFKSNLEKFTGCYEDRGLDNQSSAIKYARRGLYAARPLPAGSKLALDDVIPLRPQLDFLTPFDLENFVGKALLHDVAEGDGIHESHFSSNS